MKSYKEQAHFLHLALNILLFYILEGVEILMEFFNFYILEYSNISFVLFIELLLFMDFNHQVIDIKQKCHNYMHNFLQFAGVVLILCQNVVEQDLIATLLVFLCLSVNLFGFQFLNNDISVIFKNVLKIQYFPSWNTIPIT